MFKSPVANIKFLYEESYYDEQKLKRVLDLDRVNDIFKNMIKQGILKRADNGQVAYKLKYVGVFIVEKENGYLIIVSLPKYLKKLKPSYDEKMEHARTIVKLLKRYSSEKLTKEELYTLGNEFDSEVYNCISTMEFILKDYADYGLYTKEHMNYEINGNGEIDWNKTVGENDPYFSNGNVFYLDCLTTKSEFDENDYIRTLHKYILNRCSEFMESIEIFDVLSYPKIQFEIDSSLLGGKDFILRSIQNEMQTQFSERKLNLLKAMHALINEDMMPADKRVLLYGSKTFYNIWEKACGFVLKNEYILFERHIPKPVWKGAGMHYENKKDTLVPDILREIDRELYIFDAKYYENHFNHNGRLIGNPPGIADIVKQYSYDLAFKDVFETRYNSFVMPTTGLEIELTGTVNLECFGKSNDIKILHFPVEEVFEKYIKGEVFGAEEIQKIKALLKNEDEQELENNALNHAL